MPRSSSVLFFNTTLSLVNRSYLIFNSTYMYQLNMLTATVLRRWLFIRAGKKLWEAALKKNMVFLYELKFLLLTAFTGRNPTSYDQFLKEKPAIINGERKGGKAADNQ